MQQQQQQIEQIFKSFDISDEDLKNIKLLIGHEFELGLRDEEQATIKMLITYVREMARGDESGSYLALDLGGTHFRVLLVTLKARKAKVITAVHDIPQSLLSTQKGEELFDYIAIKLLEFVQANKLKRRQISLGFTFSFPCKQYGLTQSVLVKWCKGFQVGGVVGTDVVRQLKDALKRQLSGRVEAYIDVVAVINDTTGTLVACANTHPNCRIGLIVGTGFNVCYIESLESCEKWPANYTHPKQVIINCEWGAMGDNPARRELDKYRNEFDYMLDEQSVNIKSQTYEKMVSGMYLGELLRMAIVKLYDKGLLFAAMQDNNRNKGSMSSIKNLQQEPSPKGSSYTSCQEHKLRVKNILDGRHMSALAKDELTNSTAESQKMMLDLQVTGYTERDLTLVIELASRIITRSAHLVAAGVAALLERIRKPSTVIGYDGSVIKYHPYFLLKLKEKCFQLTSREFKFEFAVSSDGSGIGAAVVAAALHKERRPLYVLKPGKLYEMHFTRNSQQSPTSQEF